MSTLHDIRMKVIGIVDDESGKLVNPDDYDRNIHSAINAYSKHRPGTKVEDIAGNGTHDYDLPAGWIEDFSVVKSIEYPLGNVPETLLESDEYYIYRKPTGKELRVVSISPDVTQSFRVTFTILHTETTIPDGDLDALCNLAASLCLEQLANSYIQLSDSTIGADSVNYRTKSQEAASRAKRFMTLYKEHLGIDADDSTPAASAVTDMDLGYPGGGGRLTHPRRPREKR